MADMELGHEGGLGLTQKFWRHCRPVLVEKIPDLMTSACAGLAGEGSECFGCDDEISKDHDFDPAFCLWWPKSILENSRKQIIQAIKALPEEFEGHPVHLLGNRRRGPMAIEDFYFFFTGLGHPPESWQEWLTIPEEQLAASVNGEIFEDGPGIFSRWRDRLEDYYPEDVRLYKLASACMRMGQTGQYNLLRALRRSDGPSAMLCAARFSEAALSFAFLVNKRYKPFYKWAPRLARHLPKMGSELAHLLKILAEHPMRGPQDLGLVELVEEFCAKCCAFLRRQDLSNETDSWMWAQGPAIMANVSNPEIRRLDLLKG